MYILVIVQAFEPRAQHCAFKCKDLSKLAIVVVLRSEPCRSEDTLCSVSPGRDGVSFHGHIWSIKLASLAMS